MSPLRRLPAALGLAALVLALPACDSSDPVVDDGLFNEAEANPGEWVFVEVEGATCRDGSGTGIGVRLQPGADDLVIVLDGGGACFNATTCLGNRSSFGRSAFETRVAADGDAGIFNTSAASNPVAGWNAVFVPYCTGDVHGGSAPDATVPGVDGVQQFVGHQNVDLYLDLLAPYFDDVDRVLLTGASAGGFGTLVNFAAVADAFDDADLTLLNDSGPIFYADDVYSPALSAQFSALYDFPAAFPGDAGDLFETDGLQGVYDYYDGRYPDATFGLSSYLQDQTIRFFFGFGQADQTITGEEFAAGLRDIRANVPESWGTYYAPGPDHTFLGADATFFGAVAGVTYADWLAGLIDGNATTVDPDLPALTAAAR
jgi:hypothetical protein